MGLLEQDYRRLVQYVNQQLDKHMPSGPFGIMRWTRGIAIKKIEEILNSISTDIAFVKGYSIGDVMEALETAIRRGEIK